MNKMFTQPTGPVAKQTNKQAIARLLGIKQSEIGYLNTSTSIDYYTVLFDPVTQTVWSRDAATGTPISWEVATSTLTLVTTAGTFYLASAMANKIATLWDYSSYVTDRPSADYTTWDWAPAFAAAHADNKQVELLDGETYTIKTPLVYRYTNGSFSRAVRLPFCHGQAQLVYTSLGNAGEGFDNTLQVDDASQPAYEAAITVYGASGTVVIKELEGIYFTGNRNTAAIKLVGCCGLKPKNNTYAANRYGVVFNNGTATGTFTELCVPEFSRWNSACLVAIAYEKGGGDTSFHGCGLGEGCYISSASASVHPCVLIGANCQPYNAPLNANFWKSGGGSYAPLIRNSSGLHAHYYGNLKAEHSYGQVIASGSTVNFYGEISMWSGYNKGTLIQRLSGGPTGPSGGNLTFSGVSTPTTKRWDVTDAGTTVEIANYAETARITISASTWHATFIINTARRTTGIATNAPIQVISGNCNPITKFAITRTSSGISITTAESSTVIVAFRQTGLPDQSSGSAFTTTEYWG